MPGLEDEQDFVLFLCHSTPW